MSNTLVKIIDNSIFPAALMVFAKFIGVIAVITLFNLPFTVTEYLDGLINPALYLSETNVQLITSYSDLFMYGALAIVMSFNIIRAIFFHSTHIAPKFLIKLASNNLLGIIKSSYEIYTSSSVWLFFLWVNNILIVMNFLTGAVYLWVALAVTISSIVLTALLLNDVYREIEDVKKHPSKYNFE